MSDGYSGRASLAVWFILAVDRLLTWGMEPSVREAVLAEQAADWEAMSQDGDQSPTRRMLARQIKGIPMAIWWRLTRQEITAIPAAIALTIIASANLIEVTIPDYPLDHRLSLMMASTGVLIASWHLLRNPRRIHVSRLRFPALLAGIGAMWSAFTFPTSQDWSVHDPAEMTAPVIDLVMQFGIFFIGAGCAALFAASFTGRRRQAALAGGGSIVAGAGVVAAAEVIWAIWAAPADLYVSAVALGVGFGLALLAHMVLRLRNLEIV